MKFTEKEQEEKFYMNIINHLNPEEAQKLNNERSTGRSGRNQLSDKEQNPQYFAE